MPFAAPIGNIVTDDPIMTAAIATATMEAQTAFPSSPALTQVAFSIVAIDESTDRLLFFDGGLRHTDALLGKFAQGGTYTNERQEGILFTGVMGYSLAQYDSEDLAQAIRAQRAPGARKCPFNQSGCGPFPDCLQSAGVTP